MPRPTPTTILTTVIEDDFEGPLSKIWRVETAEGRSYSLNLVDSPEEAGKAARFELHSDDPYVAGNVRAELASPSGEPGVERWYYFSIYIPEDWEFDHQSEVFAQWHPVPDKDLGEKTAEGPPLIMYIDGNQISITNRSDPAAVTSADSTTRRAETVWEGAYEKGEWIDWAVRVKWSYESDGILQIWKDEQLLVDQKGPNSYNDARSPYLKLGIYKFVWKPPAWLNPEDYSRVDERVLYLDDVLIQEVVESPDSSDGNGSDGGGSQGDGSQGDGSQDDGSQDDGSQGDGSQGDGSQGGGSQGGGSQDDGSQGGGIGVVPLETPTRILGTRKGDRHVGTLKDDIVIARGGKDKVSGRSGDDLLSGGGGADVLRGQAGNDSLYGNGGRDKLVGAAGDDWLEGGKGKDIYRGGKGCDTYVLQTGRKHDVIRGFDVGCDRISIGAVNRFRQLDIVQNGRHTDIFFKDDFLGRVQRFDADDLNRSHFELG